MLDMNPLLKRGADPFAAVQERVQLSAVAQPFESLLVAFCRCWTILVFERAYSTDALLTDIKGLAPNVTGLFFLSIKSFSPHYSLCLTEGM